MGLDLNGENVEEGKHFPTQQNHRNHSHRDSQDLAEVKTAAARLEPSRHQTKDIQGCEAKNQHPQDIVDIAFLVGKLAGKLKGEEKRRLQANQTRPHPAMCCDPCDRSGKGRDHGLDWLDLQ
jgi:hypothetical protein